MLPARDVRPSLFVFSIAVAHNRHPERTSHPLSQSVPFFAALLQIDLVVIEDAHPDVLIHVWVPEPAPAVLAGEELTESESAQSRPIISLVRREAPADAEEEAALRAAENQLVAVFLGHVGTFLWAGLLSPSLYA